MKDQNTQKVKKNKLILLAQKKRKEKKHAQMFRGYPFFKQQTVNLPTNHKGEQVL